MGEVVCVSCPGKVLVTGGYLVLDLDYNGFVLATPSRFYTVVQPASASSSSTTGSANDSFEIDVYSPQFLDGHWKYSAYRDAESEWCLKDLMPEAKNTFVSLSIRAALRLASALHPSATYSSLRVTIVGSNDFYSQSRTSDVAPVPFAPLNVKIKDVHKTGLGSSAAMVTSLVSALFILWSTPSPEFASSTMKALSSPPRSKGRELFLERPDKATLALCHNLAQYVHSLAQGKVGSGFDVSAAVYGSHDYRRFSVECLGSLLDSASAEHLSVPASAQLLKALSPLLNNKWTNASTGPRVTPVTLPHGLTLMLADVDAGSNTPSMVGKILAWRKDNKSQADELWGKIRDLNNQLYAQLESLKRDRASGANAYEATLDRLSSEPLADVKTDDGISARFASLRKLITQIRGLMKEMGERAGVPVEPDEQTVLLDGVCQLPGVVGAGVPGAGGYDAVWILVVSPTDEPLRSVADYLKRYDKMSVRPLSETAWVRGADDRSGAPFMHGQGLLREDPAAVEGLQAAIMRTVTGTASS